MKLILFIKDRKFFIVGTVIAISLFFAGCSVLSKESEFKEERVRVEQYLKEKSEKEVKGTLAQSEIVNYPGGNKALYNDFVRGYGGHGNQINTQGNNSPVAVGNFKTLTEAIQFIASDKAEYAEKMAVLEKVYYSFNSEIQNYSKQVSASSAHGFDAMIDYLDSDGKLTNAANTGRMQEFSEASQHLATTVTQYLQHTGALDLVRGANHLNGGEVAVNAELGKFQDEANKIINQKRESVTADTDQIVDSEFKNIGRRFNAYNRDADSVRTMAKVEMGNITSKIVIMNQTGDDLSAGVSDLASGLKDRYDKQNLNGALIDIVDKVRKSGVDQRMYDGLDKIKLGVIKLCSDI